MRFPLLVSDAPQAFTSTELMAPTRPRLLLIEDEATISVALGRLLDRWGFDTIAARTVAEARALLGCVAVDLVVIDFRLPDMRGDDFLALLQEEFPELARRSLFITGDYGEQALSAIEGTGRPYLLKPFELGIFVHELRTLIDPLEGPRTNGRGTSQTRDSDISAA
jgi:DNA-binding response OmpR family regulator